MCPKLRIKALTISTDVNLHTKTLYEMCSKLKIKASEIRTFILPEINKKPEGHGFDGFIFNFEYISHLFLVFLSLNLNK